MDSLLEFGPAEAGASGATPVSFREIEAWAKMTRTVMPGWEARFLREMSIAYCNELHVASDPQRSEPCKGATTRNAVADQFRFLINQNKAK